MSECRIKDEQLDSGGFMIKKLSLTLGLSALLVLGFSILENTNKREVAGFKSLPVQKVAKTQLSNYDKVLSFSPRNHISIQKEKFEIGDSTL